MLPVLPQRRLAPMTSLLNKNPRVVAASYPPGDDGSLRGYERLLRQRSNAQGVQRNKEKLVVLRDGVETDDESQLQPQTSTTGRVTVLCTAGSYDLPLLRPLLEQRGCTTQQWPEVLYARYESHGVSPGAGDAFFFEYGVVVFWDLTVPQEQAILQVLLKQAEALPLPVPESDNLTVLYEPCNAPYIQNDIIRLHPYVRDGLLLKLSVSFALSQSTKLSVYEERVARVAAATRQLPITLAAEGKVRISDNDIARLIGRVFIERSQLNLVGSVLDTPDVFWRRDVPDTCQSVYAAACDYLELGDRVTILNSRLGVLHEMLDMLRLQQVALHSDHLTGVIIWLILIDVVILLVQLSATLGWIGPSNH